VSEGERLLSHAAVVPLEIDGRPLRSGYVEGVARAPDRRGEGLGSWAMSQLMDVLRSGFALGALSADRQPFYERLGWERWQGPTVLRDGSRHVGPGGGRRDHGAALRLPSRPRPGCVAPLRSALWRRLVTGPRSDRLAAGLFTLVAGCLTALVSGLFLETLGLLGLLCRPVAGRDRLTLRRDRVVVAARLTPDPVDLIEDLLGDDLRVRARMGQHGLPLSGGVGPVSLCSDLFGPVGQRPDLTRRFLECDLGPRLPALLVDQLHQVGFAAVLGADAVQGLLEPLHLVSQARDARSLMSRRVEVSRDGPTVTTSWTEAPAGRDSRAFTQRSTHALIVVAGGSAGQRERYEAHKAHDVFHRAGMRGSGWYEQ
jgi:hypothetical protein